MKLDAILHGHTHTPEDRYYKGVLIFCPGYAGGDLNERDRSVGLLDITREEIKRRVVHL